MEQQQWRVPVGVPIFKLLVAAILVGLAAITTTQWWQVLVALVVAAGVVVWAARDLIAPVRVAADAAGVTLVVGFASRRRLEWSQVERVRVDVRRRSRLLEVDVGETLHLFSRYEVDADLDDVAAALERLRTAA
jgi:hypothetical protein